jgi:hypothetical protein
MPRRTDDLQRTAKVENDGAEHDAGPNDAQQCSAIGRLQRTCPSFPRTQLSQKAGSRRRPIRSSFPRKRGAPTKWVCSSSDSTMSQMPPQHPWIPAFAGMTGILRQPRTRGAPTKWVCSSSPGAEVQHLPAGHLPGFPLSREGRNRLPLRSTAQGRDRRQPALDGPSSQPPMARMIFQAKTESRPLTKTGRPASADRAAKPLTRCLVSSALRLRTTTAGTHTMGKPPRPLRPSMTRPTSGSLAACRANPAAGGCAMKRVDVL